MKHKPGKTIEGVIGQERLDHYNAWLMNPTREFGVPYAGFPGDSVVPLQNVRYSRLKTPIKSTC